MLPALQGFDSHLIVSSVLARNTVVGSSNCVGREVHGLVVHGVVFHRAQVSSNAERSVHQSLLVVCERTGQCPVPAVQR